MPTLEEVAVVVGGTLPIADCSALAHFVRRVPAGGSILTLNGGVGRSPVVIALTLKDMPGTDVRVTTMDDHVTQPNVPQPHLSGSLSTFVRYLDIYGIHQYVVPILQQPSYATTLFPKKSFNLVVVEVKHGAGSFAESLRELIEIGKYVCRTDGDLMLIRPENMDAPTFNDVLSWELGKSTGFAEVARSSHSVVLRLGKKAPNEPPTRSNTRPAIPVANKRRGTK